MSSNSALSHSNDVGELALEDSEELDRFAIVANDLADAAGEVIRKYFRKSFDIRDKEDLSNFSFSLFLALRKIYNTLFSVLFKF